MSSKELMVDGKLLSSLRVVDLKEALEKRGLSKSGTKKDLADRLKQYVLLENERNAAVPVDEEQLPNFSTREQLAEENPFLRDYFQSQAELFHSQKVVKKLYEGMTHTPEEIEAPKIPTLECSNINSAEPLPSSDDHQDMVVSQNSITPVATDTPLEVKKDEEVVVQVSGKVRAEEPAEELSESTTDNAPQEGVVSLASDGDSAPAITAKSDSKSGILSQTDVKNNLEEPTVRESAAIDMTIAEPAGVDPALTEPTVSEPSASACDVTENTEPFIAKATGHGEVSASDDKGAPASEIDNTAIPTAPTGEPQHNSEHALRSDEDKVEDSSEVSKEGPCSLREESSAVVVDNEVHRAEAAADVSKQEHMVNAEVKSVDESSRSSDSSDSTADDIVASKKYDGKEKTSNVDTVLEESSTVSVKLDAEPIEPDLDPPSVSHVEDALDYEEEEADDDDTKSGEHDAAMKWKRQGNTDRQKSVKKVVAVIEAPANEENTPIGKQAAGGPDVHKFPKENTQRLSSNVVMDVDDALDYGEDDGEVKRELEEFSWSRRILRLKNRCTITEKIDRKWTRTDRKPVLVTSQVLEVFFPDVKPLPESEIRFDDKSVKEREQSSISAAVPLSSSEAQVDEISLPTIKRKISIIPFEEPLKELTPPRNPVTNVLIISNLTRPFTLNQLKELLQRTGAVEDIWVDKIKSKCLAKFESDTEAEETRAALHGIKWPSSNPKALIVDYSSREEFSELTSSEVDDRVRVEQPTEAKGIPVREWDLGKRSRSRSPGRIRRDTSGERKRARRSQSPSSRRSPHLGKKSRDVDLKDEAQVKALDELFRKTSTTPCLYWLPLTPQQISEKEELRRKRMIERERRIAEMEKLRPR